MSPPSNPQDYNVGSTWPVQTGYVAACEFLGGEHPDTLTSMNNLAAVLSDQGKYEQAEI